MKKLLFTSVGVVALTAPGAAFAQSTGSIDFENEIVVTGQTTQDVSGIEIPDTSKAKQVLTQEYLSKQQPGQTVLDSINLVPGVSFQNNDAYGSAGGTLNIRGFGGDRISLTFDGVPLNDSGNYAIYSNQQLSPELIEQVNVNLGTTDVDSPTGSATGGTVNYRTRKPYEDFSVRFAGTMGDFDYMRVFASVDTGNLTESGLRMFVAGEKVDHKNVFNKNGKVNKSQLNARIYQPLGDNGDFISIAGNYNENRNNFFGSVGVGTITDATGKVTLDKDARFTQAAPLCTVAAARTGLADTSNRCGSAFERRFNPSNTGNIRGASRFTLSDSLTLTIDPSYQYVKANGGGTTRGYEYGRNDADRNGANGGGIFGYVGGRPYTGVDLNGDGDLLDEVEILQPSQTQTHRFGVISSLRFDINDSNTVRLAYTFDRARHRQTGQITYLLPNGAASDVFAINNPILDVNGVELNKRDRKSIAVLHQISAEYSGRFMDDKLAINLGVRVPFFERDLTQNCFTTSASGFVDCITPSQSAAYATSNPGFSQPQNRNFKYDKFLPNIGFRFNLTDDFSVFGNYAKGLSVPGTDLLYDSFFFPVGADGSSPNPESTDSFDLGFRYTNGMVQAQLSGWFTKYDNRVARAYDPELDETISRNLGKVDKYGIDGSIAVQPTDFLTLYVFGSLSESEIKDDIQTGPTTFIPTAGKAESGSPRSTYGARAELNLGPVQFGAQAKNTGKRWVNDINTREVEGYWLVNLDARVGLDWVGLNDTTYLQFNLYNATDEVFVGGFGGDLTSTSPFVQIGAPRTFSASLNVQF